MLNSPVLDLVILLSFTYFIGSLVISAINEAIAGTFELRPKNLKRALENLSFSPDWKEYVQKTLINSPHLEALMKKQGQYPTYIAAGNFVLAIIQQLGASNFSQPNLAAAINSSDLPAGFKQVLSDIAGKCQYNTSQFEKELGTFYNNAMDRAAGWYKRRIRLILLIIGFLLSVVLNMDTIHIVDDALKDKERLARSVDNIVSKDHLDTGYSLGYTGWEDFKQQWGWDKDWSDFLFKLLGIMITAFALQLGASYWFGLLTKATDLRAAGKKPNGILKT